MGKDPNKARGHGKMADLKKTPEKPLELPSFDTKQISIELIGLSELICHQFGAGARALILAKSQGHASSAKGKKINTPEEDFEESLYRIDDATCGFPAGAFKKACVSACTSLDKSTPKTLVRQAFHVEGDLLPILDPTTRKPAIPYMRQDIVRVGRAGVNRFRGAFVDWMVQINLVYNERAMSMERILMLFNLAGFSVGVGEWRPEKEGQFGRFMVD